MTEKWFEKAPWPERFANGWENMSKEHKQEYIAAAEENHYKEEYEWALECGGIVGKPWEDLPEDKKAVIQETIRQNQKEMQEFGEWISRTFSQN